MNRYSLYEFLMLLQLDLWKGGRVGDLGKLSAAETPVVPVGKLAGIAGTPLNYRLMFEYTEPDSEGFRLFFSIYDPYSGTFSWRVVITPLRKYRTVQKAMSDLIVPPKKLIWSHQVYQRDPFRLTPRNSGKVRSLRGAPITG